MCSKLEKIWSEDFQHDDEGGGFAAPETEGGRVEARKVQEDRAGDDSFDGGRKGDKGGNQGG